MDQPAQGGFEGNLEASFKGNRKGAFKGSIEGSRKANSSTFPGARLHGGAAAADGIKS